MEVVDRSDKRCFEVLTSPENVDYPISESCLTRKAMEVTSGSVVISGIKLSEVMDEKMNINLEKVILSEFCCLCGLDLNIVKSVILAYLATSHYRLLTNIVRHYTLDLNTLAWMAYHEVDRGKWIYSIGFSHKRDEPESCVICNANTNLKRCGNRFETISPIKMSFDRKGQSYPTIDGCHYVIWALDHNDDSIQYVHMSNSSRIYRHGKNQYGHHHVHVIGGIYYDIRAKETLLNVQKKINNNILPDESDFFNPIAGYYAYCSLVGRSHIISALAAIACQVVVDIDCNLDVFYHAGYPKLCNTIEWLLCDQ